MKEKLRAWLSEEYSGMESFLETEERPYISRAEEKRSKSPTSVRTAIAVTVLTPMKQESLLTFSLYASSEASSSMRLSSRSTLSVRVL